MEDEPRVPSANGLSAALVVLGLHAVGLVGAGVFVLVRSGGHDATNHTAAVTQGVFAIVGAAIWGLLAAGCRPARPRPVVRTPALILEAILLPISVGLVQSGRPEVGVPLALSALVALFGLVTGFRGT